jgi:hypothetical protein
LITAGEDHERNGAYLINLRTMTRV